MLGYLARWLQEVTGQTVVILTDEYDAPLHAAWANDYWDEAVTFFRSFLSAGYKDTPVVFRALLTGILKVAKENIFSGLNNVDTHTLFSDEFAKDFGFTEEEVEKILLAKGLEEQRAAVRRWYNGYRFGEVAPVTIYNPWSVTKFAQQPGMGPRPFWIETSDNALVRQAMLMHARDEGERLEALLRGEMVQVELEESVVLRELPGSGSVMWNLLLFAGYLTTEQVLRDDDRAYGHVRVANVEVRGAFRGIFRAMVKSTRNGGAAAKLLDALLSGKAAEAEAHLRDSLKSVMSYFDFGGDKPIEAVYQAFVIGLWVHLSSTHDVRSNRESGYGRADVLITPKNGGAGAVLELKMIDKDRDETAEQAAESALKQVLERQYASEVLAAGAERVWQYGVAFDGKRCWVKKAS